MGDIYPISCCGRRRNDKKGHLDIRVIHKAMRDARWDLEPFACAEGCHLTVELELRGTDENVEELPRGHVVVPHFSAARRDAFLNHAKRGVLEQVPTIAARTPNVVLSGGS